MKHLFHLGQSLFGFEPIATVCLKYDKLCFCFVFLRSGRVGRRCGASYIVVYIVFIWEVNYGFAYLFRLPHRNGTAYDH